MCAVNWVKAIGVACLTAGAILAPQTEMSARCRSSSCQAGKSSVMTAEEYRQRVIAAVQKAVARAEALAKAREEAAKQNQLRKDTDAGERLAIADRLRDEGQISVAARHYSRLLHSFASPLVAEQAKARMEELRTQGEAKLTNMEERLAGYDASTGQNNPKLDDQAVVALFDEFGQLVRQYAGVSQIGDKIQYQFSVRRNQPLFSRVLQEPEAKFILDLAKDHDAEGEEKCCAYLLYEKAARLAPAPSGVAAQARLDELKADPKNVAAAEECKQVQWCHRRYNLAERLSEVKPQQALEIYSEIIERAPQDSEIFKSARQRHAELLAAEKK